MEGPIRIAQVDLCADGRAGRKGVLHFVSCNPHSAFEAGGPAGSEQLLGVGSGAAAAWRRKLDVEAAIVALRGALPATGSVNFGAVYDLVRSVHGYFLNVSLSACQEGSDRTSYRRLCRDS